MSIAVHSLLRPGHWTKVKSSWCSRTGGDAKVLLPQYLPNPILSDCLRNTYFTFGVSFYRSIPQALLTLPCGLQVQIWFHLPRLLGRYPFLGVLASARHTCTLHPPYPAMVEVGQGYLEASWRKRCLSFILKVEKRHRAL